MNLNIFKKLSKHYFSLSETPLKSEFLDTMKDVEDELERLELAWSKSEKKYQDLKKEYEEYKQLTKVRIL